MKAVETTYLGIKRGIKSCFEDDKDILKFYDPTTFVTCTDEIVSDILKKAESYKENVKFVEIIEKNKIVGYFFYKNNLLISFGLNVNFRSRKYYRFLFNEIRKWLGGKFSCILWTKNTRAIKWLQKMGMTVEFDDFLHKDNFLTKLNFN